MAELRDQKCTACRVGAPRVTQEEIDKLKPQIPEWRIVSRHGIDQLERVFVFKDFAEALAFTVRVGDLAETEGHHPAVLVEWGKATVRWWTHKIEGLHHNDFVMAAKTNQVFAGGYPPPS
jgi:4a-hydroxytetrahydrobiopterin dehydratase